MMPRPGESLLDHILYMVREVMSRYDVCDDVLIVEAQGVRVSLTVEQIR